MAGIKESYALVRLGELLEQDEPLPAERAGLGEVLREYLYGKYAFRPTRRFAPG
jgi:hypothetical protein